MESNLILWYEFSKVYRKKEILIKELSSSILAEMALPFEQNQNQWQEKKKKTVIKNNFKNCSLKIKN